MATKAKKGIYHSELDYKTRNEGGLWLQLVNTPTDSQNAKIAGFVSVIDWDGVADRYVNLENRAIRAAFDQAPQNAYLWIEAGGKGEEAWAVIKDQAKNVIADSRALMAAGAGGPPHAPPAGPPSGPPAGGPPQGAPPSAPPPQYSVPPSQVQHHQNGNGTAPSMAATMYRALEAAVEVMDRFGAEHNELTGDMTADAYMERVGAIASSFFIEFQRSGGTKLFVNPSAN